MCRLQRVHILGRGEGLSVGSKVGCFAECNLQIDNAHHLTLRLEINCVCPISKEGEQVLGWSSLWVSVWAICDQSCCYQILSRISNRNPIETNCPTERDLYLLKNNTSRTTSERKDTKPGAYVGRCFLRRRSAFLCLLVSDRLMLNI